MTKVSRTHATRTQLIKGPLGSFHFAGGLVETPELQLHHLLQFPKCHGPADLSFTFHKNKNLVIAELCYVILLRTSQCGRTTECNDLNHKVIKKFIPEAITLHSQMFKIDHRHVAHTRINPALSLPQLNPPELLTRTLTHSSPTLPHTPHIRTPTHSSLTLPHTRTPTHSSLTLKYTPPEGVVMMEAKRGAREATRVSLCLNCSGVMEGGCWWELSRSQRVSSEHDRHLCACERESVCETVRERKCGERKCVRESVCV